MRTASLSWIAVALACACGPSESRPSRAPGVVRSEPVATSDASVPAPSAEDVVEGVVEREAAALVTGDDPVPGLSVGVFADGREHYFGFGHAVDGGEPPTQDTLFHVASLTKPHTALLAALLVVDGRLDLDAPVADCAKAKIKAFCDRPKTTLRHLLSHSAGLRIVPEDSGGAYSQDKLRTYLARTKPRTPPGQRFQYSTTGYGAVALVIETRTKHGYRESLRERVLGPIDSGAVFELSARNRSRLAQGHRDDGSPAQAGPTREAFMASGGLIASASDLLRLVAVHADPSRQPSWQRAIEITRTRNDELVGFLGSAVALGWQVDRDTGYYWHPGVSSVHRTVLAYDPEGKTGVVVLANRHLALADSRLEKAAFAILRGLER